MLDKAKESRLDLQADLRASVALTTNIAHKVNLATIASDNRKLLTKNREFRNMEEGMDHLRYEMNGLHFLYEADGHSQSGNFDLAYSTYEAQIMFLRSQPNIDIKGRYLSVFMIRNRLQFRHVNALCSPSPRISLGDHARQVGQNVSTAVQIRQGYRGVQQATQSSERNQ